MSATPREIVHRTLEFAGPPRAARDLWVLPIAAESHPGPLREIEREFPPDFTAISGHEREVAPTRGQPHVVGEFTDEWGCTFINIQRGVIGEVKVPQVADWAADRARVHIPREWLTLDRDAVNRDCAVTERFAFSACCPRPFEQLQFIRGSENLYVDLADPPPELTAFLREMHAFYCELLEAWARTDVDALRFMDDWGSQRALLIAPRLWRELFKPMYRDYAQIAHARGKKLFMHSDGHIAAIYPDLVEIGIDAVNSQLFCMGVETLAPFAGKITFWGEIDRQHLLPDGTPEDIARAVEGVHRHLWRHGGCIAQCEFGAAARPENVREVYAAWDRLTAAPAKGGRP
ncbi:MAG: methyltransferase [Verrucomicrobia bacterium]|nr:methyltransferase [Verrucomicrobiota bacterium]